MVFAVAAFIVAGVVLAIQLNKGAQADMKKGERHLACNSCGAEFSVMVRLGDEGKPQTCPKCGAIAGWPEKYCSACELKFPAPLIGDPPRPAPMPNCPKCGSNKAVGAYLPEFIEAMKKDAGQ
ncbi:MAG TPA: hypothetical protein PK093_04975 [Phycisphaerae bacterium]|nr:hypothetical protein [Phycisphaerae bacterium]